MFRNGLRLDKGDLTRPGAASITGRTILEVFLVQPMVVDDIDDLFGPINVN